MLINWSGILYHVRYTIKVDVLLLTVKSCPLSEMWNQSCGARLVGTKIFDLILEVFVSLTWRVCRDIVYRFA